MKRTITVCESFEMSDRERFSFNILKTVDSPAPLLYPLSGI
jgi:hypothetical protein